MIDPIRGGASGCDVVACLPEDRSATPMIDPSCRVDPRRRALSLEGLRMARRMGLDDRAAVGVDLAARGLAAKLRRRTA